MSGSESQEMYLKTIYTISKTKGSVRKIDIANELGLAKPSITNAIDRLILSGEVRTDADNNVFLTISGEKHAKSIVNRYNTFLNMLTVMGVPDEKAKEAACKLEHAIDDDIYEYICNWMNKENKSGI